MTRHVGVLAVTLVTLAGATLLGVWYSRGRISTVESLVSAPNTTGKAPLTASLAASLLGTWILFAPPEAAVEFGGLPAVAGYATGLALPLALFVLVGVRIRRLVPHGHSITEYVLARFGRAMYAFVLVVSGAYMFVFLVVEIGGAAAALSVVAGVPRAVTAGLIGLFVFTYTGYGGLIASIVTDTLQTVVMLPLLVVAFLGLLVSLGGAETLYASVVEAEPQLLSVTNPDGVRFGIYVGLALVGGNILNQGIWQRVYAAEDERTLRQSFGLAAAVVVPVVLLAGLFGLSAVGLGLAEHGGHAALFKVLVAAEPEWLILSLTVVAVLLVMTSVDTLLSGLASLALHDLSRLVDRLESDPDDHERDEVLAIRVITGVVAGVATVIAALPFSEIRLFLTIDLLCVATCVPVVAGLYTGAIPEWGALAASVGGFLGGAVFDPVFRSALALGLSESAGTVLPSASFGVSFVTALGLSVVVTALSAAVSSKETDLSHLERRIPALTEGEP